MAKEQAPEKSPQLTLIPDIGDGSDISNGLTQSELAARLGVNASTVSRNWEKWRNQPSLFSQWAKLSKDDFRSLYPQEPHNPRSQKIPDPDGLAWETRGDRFFPVEI